DFTLFLDPLDWRELPLRRCGLHPRQRRQGLHAVRGGCLGDQKGLLDLTIELLARLLRRHDQDPFLIMSIVVVSSHGVCERGRVAVFFGFTTLSPFGAASRTCI